MGVRASPTHAITYEDVRIPADHLLGEVGGGLPQTLQVLDGGRISIGALSVGLARAALQEAERYALERTAFGKALAEHEAIQWMIADAATQIEAARLLLWQAAWLKDQGRVFTKQAAMAIANSSLVKTAFFGQDANWGRILAAVGYSGVTVDQDRIDLHFDEVLMAKNGVFAGGDAQTGQQRIAGQLGGDNGAQPDQAGPVPPSDVLDLHPDTLAGVSRIIPNELTPR